MTLSHYRQPLEFSFESLDAAATGYKNIVRKVADLMNDKSGEKDQELYQQWHDKILTPVSDNLKTAEALVVIQDLLKDKTVNNTTKLALMEFVDDIQKDKDDCSGCYRDYCFKIKLIIHTP